MIVPPPAEIGMRLAEVETPALLLDLDAFERNLTRLAERAKQMGVRLRPHAKTHKSPIIARRQMALGAVGVCCQKVSEAEAMVQGGVADVLVSNDIAGAGTGTYAFEGTSGVYNELQVGSYVFMDAHYARNLDEDGKPVSDFEHSLFVYTTVMSKPARDCAAVDAGKKALAMDSGMPTFADLRDVEYTAASDEHGSLKLGETNRPLVIGDKIRLIPGHCDPTVNLYDWYVGYRGDRVEALWPIARGPGY